MIFTDGIGNKHNFDEVPQRIVCLVPSITELLVDLGLEDALVGVTKFCVHPYHLKSTKTIVGGTKQVKKEVVSSLKPDVIIANKEENTLEIVQDLQEIAPVIVTNIITIDEVMDMISLFGLLFNKRMESQKINDKLDFLLRDFMRWVSPLPEMKAAYFIWADPYMVAGDDTFINEMLRLSKFTNVYSSRGRYPEVEIKKIRLEGDPEVVFLSSEPYPFKDEHAFELGRFTHHAKTIFVDGEMFSWYGSRLLKSFDYFKEIRKRLEPADH